MIDNKCKKYIQTWVTFRETSRLSLFLDSQPVLHIPYFHSQNFKTPGSFVCGRERNLISLPILTLLCFPWVT